MIAMRRMLSTFTLGPVATQSGRPVRRRKLTALLAVALSLSGCATHLVPPGAAIEQPRETEDAFIMPDGMRLPYRTWLPDGEQANAPGQWCWRCMA